MRQRRLLGLATAVGLVAALIIPTGALAHEVVETMVRFNGNYLLAGVDTTGPVEGIRLDVYDGKIGKGKGTSALVTARAWSTSWEPTAEPDACRVERTEWIGQSGVHPPETHITFTSPYAGGLRVSLEMYGRLLTYDGVLNSAGTWCEYGLEPTALVDLGEVEFAVAATWDSEVELRGKKLVKVRTSVDFTTVTFDGIELTPAPTSSGPVSWATRMPISVYEFVE